MVERQRAASTGRLETCPAVLSAWPLPEGCDSIDGAFDTPHVLGAIALLYAWAGRAFRVTGMEMSLGAG